MADGASDETLPQIGPARPRRDSRATARHAAFSYPVAPDLLPHLAALHTVRRDHLLRRLEDLGDGVSLVLIAAPVGHGKTTLARQWAQASSRASVWIQVDRSHRDAAQLLRDLAAAVLRVGPSGGMLGRLLTEPPVPDLEAAIERLAAGVRAVGEPVLVVLDDLHVARTRTALDVVVGLAELMPPGSQVVATVDRRPRLPARALRAQGRFLELAAEDLRFTPEEAAALLRQSGLRLAADAVHEVVERTQGWAAGLQLAATLLRDRSDPARALDAIRGDHEVFVEYFRDEVLAELSVETARFLLRTSVLDRMSGPLCDAGLGSAGSAAWLAEIKMLGLPVTQLDDRGEWYRYHPLFGEMLRSELRRREPGEDLRVLRRASRWHEDQHLPEAAITYAIAAGDADAAARLIVTHTQEINSRGSIRLVKGWIEALGDEMLRRDGGLSVMATWVWALTGDAPRARRALRISESSTHAGPLPDGSSSLRSGVLRVRAALAPDGLDVMLADAEEAVRLEPSGSDWQTMASLLLGAAQRLTGATADAARSFERAARFGRLKERPGASVALAERALLAADQGDWRTAQACASESEDLVAAAQLSTYGPSVATFLAAARVAVHEGDTERARDQTAHALDLYRDPSPVAFPWLAAQAAVELGRLLLAFGEADAAEAKVAQARRHLAVMPTVGLLLAWVEALAEDVRRARQQPELRETTTLSKAELRVLSLLPTHLSLAQIGDELVISRHTVKTQVAAVYRKLDAANRADAVRRAREAGLLAAEPQPRGR